MSKLVFIGIDGGSLDLIVRWQNRLKGFGELLHQGSYGTLVSTVPPITCPAWPAMFTGLNPAELNMFYFVNNGHINNFNDWYDKSVFKKVQDNYSVGMLNVPMTYPPPDINGFIISGMGTPPGVRNYYKPESIKEIMGDYIINPPADLHKEGMETLYARLFLNALERRVELAKKLFDEKNKDFMATVFFMTDMIQHYFWGDNNIIYKAYKLIDEYIRYVLGNHNGRIIMASDHSFTSFQGIFAVNKWLEKKGYLNLQGEAKGNGFKNLATSVATKLGNKNTQRIARFIPQGLKNQISESGSYIQETESIKSRMGEGSIAYSVGISGAVYVTNKNKTDEIYEQLLVESRNKFGVYKRDMVFRGRYINNAPDIMIVPKVLCPSGGEYDRVYNPPFAKGMHSMDGFYIDNGSLEKGRNDRQIYEIHDLIMRVFE